MDKKKTKFGQMTQKLHRIATKQKADKNIKQNKAG